MRGLLLLSIHGFSLAALAQNNTYTYIRAGNSGPAHPKYEFGIAMNRVQYQNESVDNGALERFATVVPLAGGYSNLRKFIQSVESSDNFLVIERVALGTGKSSDLVELNITLATYFIAPDANLDELGKKPSVPQRSS
jgi:hypothetical protein